MTDVPQEITPGKEEKVESETPGKLENENTPKKEEKGETPGNTDIPGKEEKGETPGNTNTPGKEETPGNKDTPGKEETPGNNDTPGKEEKEKEIQSETKKIIDESHLLLKSMIDSKELSNMLEFKIGKYKNSLRKLPPNKKDKDYISKLEEGYESSDSGDSVQSSSTVLTNSTSSTLSGLSYMSFLPGDLNPKMDNNKSNETTRIAHALIFFIVSLHKLFVPSLYHSAGDKSTGGKLFPPLLHFLQ